MKGQKATFLINCLQRSLYVGWQLYLEILLSLSLFKYFFHAYFAIFECSQGGGGFMPIPCVSHHTPTSLFGNILPFVHEAFCESA